MYFLSHHQTEPGIVPHAHYEAEKQKPWHKTAEFQEYLYQPQISDQPAYKLRYLPHRVHLEYAKRYERPFHPFADVRRLPWNKLKLHEGEYTEAVTYFTTRKQVLLTDDTDNLTIQHENRHCFMPDMLEHENHAWDNFEQNSK